MALHPKRDSENTSLKGMMSRALGSRLSKRTDDPVPDLQDVLTTLDVSERDAPAYAIQRVEFPETAATQPSLEAHRQRLQHLLESARQIEEMLVAEAAQARELSANLKLDEKRAAVAEAIEAEQKVTAEAQAFTKNRDTAAAFQAKADAEVASTRRELADAEALVTKLQTQLRDAQDLVVVSKSKLVECESKSAEAAKRVELAKGLAYDAECRIAKCREARETAQTELAQAEEIATSIALTADTLKRIRELGKA